MSTLEILLGLVTDIVLPIDVHTRYDLYFTDKRVAIISMGSTDRIDYGKLGRRALISAAVGVAPAIFMYADEVRTNKPIEEKEVEGLTLDELLKLRKKSCYYTYEEIEQVRLISGEKSKFWILSKECESKFLTTEEQFEQLTVLLPTIEMLKSKLKFFDKNNNPRTVQNKQTSENKDLNQENEKLRKKIKELEAENSDLKSYIDSLRTA